MNDLLEILDKAKNNYTFNTQKDFIELLNDIGLYDNLLKLDWDDGAGEEWARFIHEKHGVVYMINSKIGVIFARNIYKEKIPCALFSKYTIYLTENYDKDEWYINLKGLETQVPQIEWHASEDAVNPRIFSLNDLYFATI